MIVISMLRGVNVGAHHRVKMDALRAVYTSLELRDVKTFLQSGNVAFRTEESELVRLARRIEDALERTFRFRPDVILRTAAELRDVVTQNPFAGRDGLHPAKLHVMFLAADPGEDARARLRAIKTDPEEVRIGTRELYIYYPNGIGRSKLPAAAVEKALEVAGTGRNWNSVTGLLNMAEELER